MIIYLNYFPVAMSHARLTIGPLSHKRGEEQEMPNTNLPLPVLIGDIGPNEDAAARKRDDAKRRWTIPLVPLHRAGSTLLRVHHNYLGYT